MNAKKRQMIIRIFAGCLFLGLAWLVWYLSPPNHPKSNGMQEFFTDDDGATWFPEDGTKIPPFNHNGKQAVLAKVYQCPDGTQFVGYLEKFSDPAKAKIEAFRGTTHPIGGIAATTGPSSDTVLIKKPHQTNWIGDSDPAAKEVKTFTAPNGQKDYVPALP